MDGFVLLFAVICLAVLPCATQAGEDSSADPVQIVVSILPQAWFAERVGGELVDVSVLVGPGQSPATFDPRAKQVSLLQKADLFFIAGVPFENGLMPRIARLESGPQIFGVSPPSLHDNDHGNGGHDHHGLDPHTWLDPHQAMVMADTMRAALSRLRPEAKMVFQSNLNTLRDSLGQLDQDIRAILSPHQGREFYVFHPAFGHFADAYGLSQVSIEADGHEPSAKHLVEIIGRARSDGASAIIVQPQFSRKSARSVAKSLNVEVVSLDPLASQYDSNMREIATTLDVIFSSSISTTGSKKDSP